MQRNSAQRNSAIDGPAELRPETIAVSVDRSNGAGNDTALLAKARAAFFELLSANLSEPVLHRQASYFFLQLNEACLQGEEAPKNAGAEVSGYTAGPMANPLAELSMQYYLYLPVSVKPDTLASGTFSRLLIDRLEPRIARVTTLIGQENIDTDLAELLIGYMSHLGQSGKTIRQTLGALSYFESWVNCLLGIPQEEFTADHLFDQLLLHNFNYLPFARYWQGNLQEKLKSQPERTRQETLESLQALIKSGLDANTPAFDPRWPSLARIMSGWLEEELAQAPKVAQTACSKKFPLTIPVAQLACLLKLFYEESQVPVTASELIRWAAANLSTKRQPDISPRSLSKEFYSVTQFTAARVREILLQMAGRINADYFP